MSITGTSQPTKVGVPIADLIAGMNGAFGVLAALLRAGVHRPRPGRAYVAARRHGRRARVPGHPLDGGRRGARAGRRPPPVDRAVRHVRDGDRADPDRLRVRGSVARPVRRARLGPGRGRPRHQPRAGRQPGRADRQARGALRRLARRALALAAVGGRRAVGQGPLDGRRLLVGPGALAGPAPRRRALDPRRDPAARLTAALRRQRLLRRPRDRTSPRPRSASTTSRSGSGSTREPRLARAGTGGTTIPTRRMSKRLATVRQRAAGPARRRGRRRSGSLSLLLPATVATRCRSWPRSRAEVQRRRWSSSTTTLAGSGRPTTARRPRADRTRGPRRGRRHDCSTPTSACGRADGVRDLSAHG